MKRIMALLLCAILGIQIVTTNINVYAKDESGQVIKVAITGYPQYLSKNDDGTYSGYAYEYLMEIAKYTGWTYEFEEMSLGKAIKSIKAGDIDIIPGCQYSKDRTDYYDVPNNNMGYGGTVLCVKNGDTKYAYNDYDGFEGMRIGGLMGADRIEITEKIFDEKEVDAEFKTYDMMEDMEKALDDGEIDAALLSSIRMNNKYKIIARINSVPVYFACNKKNKSICRDIDDACSRIHMEDREFEFNLEEKYYGDISDSMAFSEEERKYINEIKKIKVGVYEIGAPMVYIDEKTGAKKGIIIDVLDKISDVSGIDFEYVFLDKEYNEYSAEYFENKNISLFVGKIMDQNVDNAVTNSFFKCSSIVITKKGSDYIGKGGVIATSKKSELTDTYLKTVFGGARVKTCESVLSCMKMVYDGEVDAVFGNQYQIQLLAEKENYNDICVLGNMSVDEEYGIINLDRNLGNEKKSEEKMKIDIFNKSIECISDDDINRIVIKNTVKNIDDRGFDDLFEKYRYVFELIGIVFVTVVASFVIVIRLRHRAYIMVQDANVKLEDALMQANKANSAKSDFLARMSHDMRTPMNAIIGFSDNALCENADKNQLSSNMKKINESGEYLLSLINDILDMAKIESDKLVLNYKEERVEKIIDEVEAVIKPVAEKKNIDFFIELDGVTEKNIMVDSLRVKQIFINLLGNAVKFTPEGGMVTFVIKHLFEYNNRVYDSFVIKDSGVGMDAEYLPKMYDAFSQEQLEVEHTCQGTGMGLAIVKKLVDAMNGSIECESVKGHGTIFTVNLSFEIVRKENGEEKEEISNFKNIKVLQVEDNEINAMLVNELLNLKNVNVVNASNGKEAVEKFSESDIGEFDMIFMDIHMPVMGGIEAAKRIRMMDRLDAKKIPIVAMTANAFKEDIEMCIASGMNEHMAKPIKSEKLYEILGKYVIQQ